MFGKKKKEDKIEIEKVSSDEEAIAKMSTLREELQDIKEKVDSKELEVPKKIEKEDDEEIESDDIISVAMSKKDFDNWKDKLQELTLLGEDLLIMGTRLIELRDDLKKINIRRLR